MQAYRDEANIIKDWLCNNILNKPFHIISYNGMICDTEALQWFTLLWFTVSLKWRKMSYHVSFIECVHILPSINFMCIMIQHQPWENNISHEKTTSAMRKAYPQGVDWSWPFLLTEKSWSCHSEVTLAFLKVPHPHIFDDHLPSSFSGALDSFIVIIIIFFPILGNHLAACHLEGNHLTIRERIVYMKEQTTKWSKRNWATPKLKPEVFCF